MLEPKKYAIHRFVIGLQFIGVLFLLGQGVYNRSLGPITEEPSAKQELKNHGPQNSLFSYLYRYSKAKMEQRVQEPSENEKQSEK